MLLAWSFLCIHLLTSIEFLFSGSAGQQCCYDNQGNVLKPPHPGAGTPDKEAGKLTNVYDHFQDDVRPYYWCCLDCEEPETYCPKYTVEARGLDTSHCNK